MSLKKSVDDHLAKSAILIACMLAFSPEASAIPAGWTINGNGGTLGPNGVVTAAPSPYGPDYNYITTNGGAIGTGGLSGVGGTNGSTLTSSLFSATAGAALEYNFNYVTSDGAGFADYAWARLLAADGITQVALLFTARTKPSGDIVPGFGLPATTPGVILSPASTAIIPGGPGWSPLGSSSGACYAAGCGYTGWINSSFSIPSAGNYYVQFGVTNWGDTAFNTGLAISGATIGGTTIDDLPEPASLALFGIGLAGLLANRRRKNLA